MLCTLYHIAWEFTKKWRIVKFTRSHGCKLLALGHKTILGTNFVLNLESSLLSSWILSLGIKFNYKFMLPESKCIIVLRLLFWTSSWVIDIFPLDWRWSFQHQNKKIISCICMLYSAVSCLFFIASYSCILMLFIYIIIEFSPALFQSGHQQRTSKASQEISQVS